MSKLNIGVNQSQLNKSFTDISTDDSIRAYANYLKKYGYAQSTTLQYCNSTAHFIHWISLQNLQLSQINETIIQQFLDDHLPQCQCLIQYPRARHIMSAALTHYLAMLRLTGACPQRSPLDTLVVYEELSDFNRYLLQVCGLAHSTCTSRLRHARVFLVTHFATNNPIKISTLTPTDITNFVTHYSQKLTPTSIKGLCTSLRSYFRFKASQGVPTTMLIAALPRIAQWRLSGLPDVLSTSETMRFIKSFDRNTATGKRDYAIARCVMDLGLRRTEVASLQLDNIDWCAGTLHIHSKGKRIDVMPLPWSTGEAIVDYLSSGRPSTTRREIFVRHRPPINTPANLDIIRNAIRNAAKRCGLDDRIRGTHIFRHTAATRMVRAGTPLKEISDLLRHRHLDTTTIYAKVDFPSLKHVAMSWPRRRS